MHSVVPSADRKPRFLNVCQSLSPSETIEVFDSSQELFRKVRSILNKLTPQKFNQLMKQITDLTIDTEERLKGVIDLVFEKAIDEPNFSVAYGNMCRCLATVSRSLGIVVLDGIHHFTGFPTHVL